MESIKAFLRNPFSFLFATKGAEERVAAYIVREHDRGRTLDDILDDPYVVNRCTEREIARVLERPEVIHAIGEDVAEAHRAAILSAGAARTEAEEAQAGGPPTA